MGEYVYVCICMFVCVTMSLFVYNVCVYSVYICVYLHVCVLMCVLLCIIVCVCVCVCVCERERERERDLEVLEVAGWRRWQKMSRQSGQREGDGQGIVFA